MILNRYLRREISKPLLPVLGILVALFGSYSAATLLSDAVNGLLPGDIITELVGLKVLISLEVLIPVALYMSVILSFGRLYSDSELTAAYALRITPAQISGAVLVVAGCAALAVAGLSLVVRPWAYQKLHTLSSHAASTLDVAAMQPGTFYIGQHGRRVIFLGHRHGPTTPARDVFVQLWRGDHIRIIHARLADKLPQGQASEGIRIDMHDAHIYTMDLGSTQNDQVLSARDLIINPDGTSDVTPEYSSVAASSPRLVASNLPADIAELQWRLSTPISTLLLGLLGIPMSRARPRQSKYSKLGAAILIYFGYYLLCTSTRTWVQHDMIAGFPGVWWAPGLLSLFLLAVTYRPRRLERGRA
ncbi:LPS export ABC transporter permease LptF [Lichenicoccus sp.]|uniref:LPS export ABC transporter permease LptF n=1 Tax=Lichenicoccus sp. TaxID=2781899 RepID=UPI003D0E3499